MPVTFLGVTSSVGTTAANRDPGAPAHAVGDLLIGWAFGASNPNYVYPPGFIPIPVSFAGYNAGGRCGYKISDGTGTGGGWGSPTLAVFIMAFSGQSKSNPIGNYGNSAGNSSTVRTPGIAHTQRGGESAAAIFCGHTLATSWSFSSGGFTNRTAFSGNPSNGTRAFCGTVDDTNNATNAALSGGFYPGYGAQANGSSGSSAGTIIEILPEIKNNFMAFI